jgi:hypothetical protein
VREGREEPLAGRVLGGARSHADVIGPGLAVRADPLADVASAADRADLFEELRWDRRDELSAASPAGARSLDERAEPERGEHLAIPRRPQVHRELAAS